jgi:hypothetical protein
MLTMGILMVMTIAMYKQEGLNIITELFWQMGLQINLKKTKAMIHFGHSTSHHMSSTAYAHRYDKSLPMHWEQSLQKMTMPKIQCIYES